jgi:uncharacterized peroxidase-related enzyme
MAWIKTVSESQAEGLLARIYKEAQKRRGHISNIRKIQSNNPPALRGMLELYKAVVLADSPLTRAQREMLAVVVSRINGCVY